MIERIFRNPITIKRLRRFKEIKRAYYAFWILAALYAFSLGAELICNNAPLYVRFNGRSYFPVFKFYPEKEFTGGERNTRPDYRKLAALPAFQDKVENHMVFAPIPYGPFESIDPAEIMLADQVTLSFEPVPLIGNVNIDPDFNILSAYNFGPLVGKTADDLKGLDLRKHFRLPPAIQEAVARRFANQRAPAAFFDAQGPDGLAVTVQLSVYEPRPKAPATVRLTFREAGGHARSAHQMVLDPDLKPVSPAKQGPAEELWQALEEADRSVLLSLAQERFKVPVDPYRLAVNDQPYTVNFLKEDVRFPYPPVKGHLFGIDGAGRDVLARILYGLRTSLTFGLLLVGVSYLLGIMAGALQGYYGGVLDISGQRMIEIWSALPFLYIMILMGSVYGRSFALLLFCYGLFNWIGISYYTRAEFLRLRKLPFVEAAKCMGIRAHKVIFKHILPNAMVPVITFFPFSLVGAIGSLAALDYLGFGLPPPTPSWGELLFQAQQYRWAWWLILYPSLALFTVMLLGVFVGEGIRNAYDPKRYTRLE